MELLKIIKEKAPEYDSSFESLIMKFTVGQGGKAGTSSKSASWEQGKYFANKYEIYMYATILGLKNKYRLPFQSSNKTKFIEIKFWQPSDLAEYIIMGILAESEIDFNELEKKEDKEVEKEILSIKKLLEEFANGGFDKIRAKFESSPSFFENNDNCFIDLLDQV